MEQIAAGKGRGPKRFITGGSKAQDPKAIWHSSPAKQSAKPHRGLAKLQALPAARKTAPVHAAAMPRFIGPQLCKTVSRPPSGKDWVHEIKFDGYRMPLRIEGGAATLRTRKGLDWTSKFRATAEAAAALPNCIVDGEVVALDQAGAPNFSALQAALSEGRSQDLIYFAFDLLFAEREDLRAHPLSERKGRLKKLLDRHLSGSAAIRYVDHLADSGDAVLRSACQMNLEGIVSKRLSASYRSQRTRAGSKPSAVPAMKWLSAAGAAAQPIFARSSPAPTAAIISSMSDKSARASMRRIPRTCCSALRPMQRTRAPSSAKTRRASRKTGPG
jgi:bifunctional non-homologous end joining protein LigD